MKNKFQHFATRVSHWTGSTNAFLLAFAVVVIWLLVGPRAGFSDTWLMTIATVTDVIIFLMVFLIQNTQNRDSKAIQLKLNELIIANKKARDAFIGLEELTDNELSELDDEFKRLSVSLEVAPSVRKLHTKINHERARRGGLYDQAGRVVDALLSPFSGKNSH